MEYTIFLTWFFMQTPMLHSIELDSPADTDPLNWFMHQVSSLGSDCNKMLGQEQLQRQKIWGIVTTGVKQRAEAAWMKPSQLKQIIQLAEKTTVNCNSQQIRIHSFV